MFPILRWIGSVLLFISIPSVAAEPSAPLSPQAAVDAALQNHAQLQSTSAALLQAQGQRDQAAVFLGNPNISGSFSLLNGARSSASISQPISLSGTGWHARRAARTQIDAQEAKLTRAKLIAAAQARQAYVRAVVAAQIVSVAQQGVTLLSRLRQAVARQEQEGEASELDLHLAKLAQVQAVSSLLAAQASEAKRLQQLAATIGRPVDRSALNTDPASAVPPSSAAPTEERSDVRAAAYALESATANLRRQRAASLPPLRVGVSLNVEDGQPFVGPSLAMALPVFNRNQAGRASALGLQARAQATLATTGARAQTEQLTARHRVEQLDLLLPTLTPEPMVDATKALHSVEAGYLGGEIDLPRTVLVQRQILAGQTAAIRLTGQLAQARLDLLLATEDPTLLGGAQ